MTTLAALVAATPAAAHGQPVTIDDDTWRHVVEIADPGAGSSVVWHDITEWFCGYEYNRGADTYLGRYRASVATVEVCRGDDMLAPWNDDTSALFGVHVPLGPGLLIRSGFIRVVDSVVTEWLPRFTNKVESWGDAAWSAGKIRRHLIVARDTLTSLVTLPLPAQSEENWSDRMYNWLVDTGWPYGSLIYGAQFEADTTTPILLLPDRPATSSALTELDATLDPVGLVWYTNRLCQLVVRPRTDDTFHADAFAAGATGDEWPGDTDPITYAWWACQDDDDDEAAAYAVDNQTEPFGFDTTERAIINHVKIAYPAGGFDDDDPISIQRFDRKTLQASWIAANDVVAAQTLATRAYATVEARPLHSALGLERFYPEATAADFLSYVTIDHRNTDTGLSVSGNGWVRSLTERVAPRGCEVDWSITTIVDVYATESTAAMLPVEDLMLVDVSESDAEFSWSNPSQTIIPTNTQIRLAGASSIWGTTDYPITGVIWHGLAPDTVYTFQVRLVQYTDGLITAFSPLREITFRTDPATVPVIDGGTGILVPPDAGCVLEWQLQSSSDGTTWSTVDSGTITTAPFEVDLTGYTFSPVLLYRLRQREVCAGVPGPYTSSNLFVGECSEPAILGSAPYDDADLEAYWPGICPPDTVVEVITEQHALRGWAFDLFTVDGAGSVVLVADGDGPVTYGATPTAVSALHLDTTIACRVQLAHQPAAPVVLFSAAGLYIDAIPSGLVWKVRARCQETGVTTITPGSTLAFGVWYDVALVHDESAGDLILYVDGVDVAHQLGGVTARTNPNRFQIGASNDGLITNCAVWSRVLADTELPGYVAPTAPAVTINQASGQADPATGTTILFDVVFDQAVSGFATGDVTLTGTASSGAVAIVTGTGPTYTVTVSGYTTGGTITASIAASVCTGVYGGLGNAASTSTDNTVTIPALTVTINQGGSQADPATSSPVVFDAVTSEAVTGFATGDITLSGTASPTTATVTDSGDHIHFTVSVSGMTASGTVIATIGAAKFTALSTGVGNDASTSTDNTVTFNMHLHDVIQSLSPLSHWPLRESSGSTHSDIGSLANNSSGASFSTVSAPDGFTAAKYTTNTAGGSAADKDDYTPSFASGITVCFAVNPNTGTLSGGSGDYAAKNLDAGGSTEWFITWFASGKLAAATNTSAGATARQTATNSIVMVENVWQFVIVRFDGSTTGYPDIRYNGTVPAQTQSATGTATGNQTSKLQIGRLRSASGGAQAAMSHLAIFAGKLSNADCALLEAAADSDGFF